MILICALHYWLPSIASSSSFNSISTQYEERNFKLEFGRDNEKLIISKIVCDLSVVCCEYY